jgi:hypothetical protein
VHITSAHDSSGPNDSLTFTYAQVALTTKNADGSGPCRRERAIVTHFWSHLENSRS